MAQNAARAYWRLTVLWLIVGCSLGTLAGLSLLSPDAIGSRSFLTFGRLVAAHRAVIIHGVLFSAVFASGYTLLPRLCQASQVSRPLSVGLSWIGTAIVLLGVISILSGSGSGEEYADLPKPLAFLFWLYLVAAALDIGLLLAKAKSLMRHPAQGLLLLGVMIPAVIYPFAIPDWLGVGLFASVRTWMGWRTIFISGFAASALGLSLWAMGSRKREVRLQRGPLVIGVVLLVAMAPFTGLVHLLDAPIEPGLKALGAFTGAGLAVGIILLVITIWRKTQLDPPGVLSFCGLAGLIACSVQGAFMLFPPIYSAFHYTMSTSGHAHLALGAIACLFLSGALIFAPRLALRKLEGSDRAMPAVGMFITGLTGVVLFLSASGIVQATSFARTLGPSDWLPAVRWLQIGTSISGILAIVGASMIGSMILRTLAAPLTSRTVSTADTENSEIVSEGGDG